MVNLIPVISAIFGCLGGGYLADRFGRKPMLLAALVVSYAAITMEFIATTNELFFGGKFLNGFATGCIATVCVTYLGEVCKPLNYQPTPFELLYLFHYRSHHWHLEE